MDMLDHAADAYRFETEYDEIAGSIFKEQKNLMSGIPGKGGWFGGSLQWCLAVCGAQWGGCCSECISGRLLAMLPHVGHAHPL